METQIENFNFSQSFYPTLGGWVQVYSDTRGRERDAEVPPLSLANNINFIKSGK